MPDYLFAYGTLQSGLAPPEVEHLVARMRPLGPATVPGALYDFGSYPGAVIDPHSPRRIVGAVFAVPADPEFWRELDAYEECDPAAPDTSQFLRVRHSVERVQGPTLDCWIYVYNRSVDGARIVDSDVPWTKP